MRHLATPLLASLLLVGVMLPARAQAHVRAASIAAESGTHSALVAPGAEITAWLLLGLAGAAILATVRRRPRRVLGVVLLGALAVLSFESGVHSVHHLDAHDAATCAVAAAAGHLSDVLASGLPALRPDVVELPPLPERPATSRPAPRRGPDPARAPPSPIA